MTATKTKSNLHEWHITGLLSPKHWEVIIIPTLPNPPDYIKCSFCELPWHFMLPKL